jgi:hypothetical protein
MSSEDPCSDELSAVVEAFNRRGTVELGLDVEGDAPLQLRKACRILDGVRALRNIDRHHTLVVEGSFAALERTVQFYREKQAEVVHEAGCEERQWLTQSEAADVANASTATVRAHRDTLEEQID